MRKILNLIMLGLIFVQGCGGGGSQPLIGTRATYFPISQGATYHYQCYNTDGSVKFDATVIFDKVINNQVYFKEGTYSCMAYFYYDIIYFNDTIISVGPREDTSYRVELIRFPLQDGDVITDCYGDSSIVGFVTLLDSFNNYSNVFRMTANGDFSWDEAPEVIWLAPNVGIVAYKEKNGDTYYLVD